MSEQDRKRRKMSAAHGSSGGNVKNDADTPGTSTSTSTEEETCRMITTKASALAAGSSNSFMMVKDTSSYRDKTKHVKVLFDCCFSVVQVTAPSRFGKTTFMHTVKTFCEIPRQKNGQPITHLEDEERKSGDVYKMFMDLELGKEDPDFVKKHCGQYPVISMSLKDVGCETERDETEQEQKDRRQEGKEQILQSLREAIGGAFLEHYSYLVKNKEDGTFAWHSEQLGESGHEVDTYLQYALTSRQAELGLKFLTNILYTHFGKKVIILIDECDAPIMKAIHKNMDNVVLLYLISLISDLMSATLKDRSDYVERALLNSCVRLSGVFSWDLNNRYDALFLQTSAFSKIYGFTTEEVKSLFDKPEFENFKDLDGVKKWYAGYQVLRKKTVVYNSWSIINFLTRSIEENEKMLGSYWPIRGYAEILKNLFESPMVQKLTNTLLQGKTITIRTYLPTVENILDLKSTVNDRMKNLKRSHVHFFFQLLMDNGLLTPSKLDDMTTTLKIPNLETTRAIQSIWYSETLFETIKNYKLNPQNITRFIKVLYELVSLAEELDQKKGTEEEDLGEEEEDLGEEEEDLGEEEEEDSEGTQEDKLLRIFNQLVVAVSHLFSEDTVPHNESELHHILFILMLNSAMFTTRANTPVEAKRVPKGKHGRKKELDILVTCGIVGMIFEFKFSTKVQDLSKEALNQIREKKYYNVFSLKKYKAVKTKIYVGLHCDVKRNVSLRYVTNDHILQKTDIDAAAPITSTAIKT